MLVRTQLLLPEETLTQLRFLAKERNTSVSDVVRTVLKKNFALQQSHLSGTKSLQTLVKRANKTHLPKGFSSTTVDDLYMED